ncbi:class I SAM-dependent methyltransferase [archaeon]|nr:MAG: class I SAM-dependent methyltransferase [archaeon]
MQTVDDFTPDSNADFKLQEYWERRFQKEESYEWLTSWKNVRTQILPYIKPTDRILIVGCGNSSFSADIYDEGFHNITNIDFAESVITRLRELHVLSRPEMSWEVMDMTALAFTDESFDVVLDKAAMDALVVDEGDVWDPDLSVIDVVDKMCLGISKVLKSTGIHMQISFAQPHFRTKYLIGYRAEGVNSSPYQASTGLAARYGWSLSYETIENEGGCLNSFLYIMKKQ